MSTPANKIPLKDEIEREVKSTGRNTFYDKSMLSRFMELIRPSRPIPMVSPIVVTGEGSRIVNDPQEQMELRGITSRQASTYRPGLSDEIFNLIEPYAYRGKDLVGVFSDLVAGRRSSHPQRSEGFYQAMYRPEAREDAWRLYLGMPQIANTFSVSRWKPTRADDPNAEYFEINDFFSHYIDLSKAGSAQRAISRILDELEWKEPFVDVDGSIFKGHILGRFQWSKGKDDDGHYIAYYDKWDLAAGGESEKGRLGKPFEIYGRIYYDPETNEPIDKENLGFIERRLLQNR